MGFFIFGFFALAIGGLVWAFFHFAHVEKTALEREHREEVTGELERARKVHTSPLTKAEVFIESGRVVRIVDVEGRLRRAGLFNAKFLNSFLHDTCKIEIDGEEVLVVTDIDEKLKLLELLDAEKFAARLEEAYLNTFTMSRSPDTSLDALRARAKDSGENRHRSPERNRE